MVTEAGTLPTFAKKLNDLTLSGMAPLQLTTILQGGAEDLEVIGEEYLPRYRTTGLRETLAELYESVDLRRVLCTFHLPASAAVAGTYKLAFNLEATLLINEGDAPFGTVLGLVADNRKLLTGGNTVGSIFGLPLNGLNGTYVFHNLADWITLEAVTVGGEPMLTFKNGFSTPNYYSKLTDGGSNTNGLIAFEDRTFDDPAQLSYITPGEAFDIHLVLDIPANTDITNSFLIHWDATLQPFVWTEL